MALRRSLRGNPPQAGTGTTSSGLGDWVMVEVDSLRSADLSCLVVARRPHVQKNMYVKWNEPAAQICMTSGRRKDIATQAFYMLKSRVGKCAFLSAPASCAAPPNLAPEGRPKGGGGEGAIFELDLT